MQLLLMPLLDGCNSDYHPEPIGGTEPTGTLPAPLDRDQDGYVSSADCNDLDATTHPGAYDGCDGKDNDCDTFVDGTGAANERCQRTTTFDQTMTADVLVVVSNSSSMQAHGYWQSAADGAYEMARHLVGDPGDETHLGILLDDLGSTYDGRLIAPSQFQDAGTFWLDGATVDDLAKVRQFYGAIWDRDDPTDGPRGMRAAVEDVLADGQKPWLNGFFREDAMLDIVMITDGEDLTLPTDTTFLNDLAHFKGSLDRVRIYAVTQTTTFDCAHHTTVEAASIVSLAEQTGGLYESVCSLDWTGFMSGVGQDIAKQSLRGTFPLDSPARLGSDLVVKVTRAGADEFIWNPNGYALENPTTLVFLGVRPPAGSTIEIDWLEDWML